MNITEIIKKTRENEPEIKELPFSMIIYGQGKCGKTTLAQTVKEEGETLLINFENRVNHFKESENLFFYPTQTRMCTGNDLRTLTKSLKDNPDHGIKYVIIDTIDAMFQCFEKEIIGTSKKDKVNISFDERKVINNKMESVISVFRNDLSLNIILICHSKKGEDGKTTLSLSNSLKNNINNKCDYIFYLEMDNGNKRILRTSPNFLYEAGQSTPEGTTMPDIEEPTMSKIVKYIRGENIE